MKKILLVMALLLMPIPVLAQQAEAPTAEAPTAEALKDASVFKRPTFEEEHPYQYKIGLPVRAGWKLLKVCGRGLKFVCNKSGISHAADFSLTEYAKLGAWAEKRQLTPALNFTSSVTNFATTTGVFLIPRKK